MNKPWKKWTHTEDWLPAAEEVNLQSMAMENMAPIGKG